MESIQFSYPFLRLRTPDRFMLFGFSSCRVEWGSWFWKVDYFLCICINDTFAILVPVSSGLFYKILRLCVCVLFWGPLVFVSWSEASRTCPSLAFAWLISGQALLGPFHHPWSKCDMCRNRFTWILDITKLDNSFLHSVRIDMWSHIARPGPRIRQVGQSFPGDRWDKKEGNQRWWIQMNHAFHNKISDRWSDISNFIWSCMFTGLLEHV